MDKSAFVLMDAEETVSGTIIRAAFTLALVKLLETAEPPTSRP
jgi:hypothetical protein